MSESSYDANLRRERAKEMRGMADEMRGIADAMSSSEAQQEVKAIARAYERLAEHADRKASREATLQSRSRK
jgi:hypothetical protein